MVCRCVRVRLASGSLRSPETLEKSLSTAIDERGVEVPDTGDYPIASEASLKRVLKRVFRKRGSGLRSVWLPRYCLVQMRWYQVEMLCILLMFAIVGSFWSSPVTVRVHTTSGHSIGRATPRVRRQCLAPRTSTWQSRLLNPFSYPIRSCLKPQKCSIEKDVIFRIFSSLQSLILILVIISINKFFNSIKFDKYWFSELIWKFVNFSNRVFCEQFDFHSTSATWHIVWSQPESAFFVVLHASERFVLFESFGHPACHPTAIITGVSLTNQNGLQHGRKARRFVYPGASQESWTC